MDDTQNTTLTLQLREALGDGAATVVNEGSIDQVYAQVKAALAPTIQKQPPPSSAQPPPSAPAAAANPTPNPGKENEEDQEAQPLMFGGLMLTGSPARALRRAGIKQPTEVQEVALPRIMRGESG